MKNKKSKIFFSSLAVISAISITGATATILTSCSNFNLPAIELPELNTTGILNTFFSNIQKEPNSGKYTANFDRSLNQKTLPRDPNELFIITPNSNFYPSNDEELIVNWSAPPSSKLQVNYENKTINNNEVKVQVANIKEQDFNVNNYFEIDIGLKIVKKGKNDPIKWGNLAIVLTFVG